MITSPNPAKILVVDELPPEDIAMVQALYSRDPRSVEHHLKRVAEVGSGKFMGTYYIGYGHKSIGDCGTTTIFIEGCSMLCAKAVQDWLLYSGQEASTRYLLFDTQPIYYPSGGDERGPQVQRDWLDLYNRLRADLEISLTQQHPAAPGDDPKVHAKAVKARCFDIARGFLPAGMTTMLSWHTNLRQAADHLQWMSNHPMAEVRDVADGVMTMLRTRYPSSMPKPRDIGDLITDREVDQYYRQSQKTMIEAASFLCFPVHHPTGRFTNDVHGIDFLKSNQLDRFAPILRDRPRKCELPFQTRCCGDMLFDFLIDYGSYRDLQRQRSVVAIQPILTTDYGMHPWYLSFVPDHYRSEIDALALRTDDLQLTIYQRQYCVPMAFQVPIEMTATLPAAVYIAELRSGKTVHPTVRPVAQQIGVLLKRWVPTLALYIDESPDQFSARRGSQDIEAIKMVDSIRKARSCGRGGAHQTSG
jgi:thymidylate synthase ThyX